MADTTADYQLVKILGRGAFGEAVLYRRLEDNSLVVWKEILLMNASEKQRFHAMQEASLLSLLSHPNIIAYYNDFMDGSTLLIEMEYANGGTLNRKIYTGLTNDELFAERWILWMFYQIVSAVNYVHDRSIIHRDIKSLNIFLNKLGLCKLGDFGLARSLSASERQAVTSNVGTVAYMSPEIYKGEIYNEGSDVWAVGCVLYEMAARRLPFAANEIGRLAVEIVETSPKELDNKYSPEMKALCMQMLEKDPTKRPSIGSVLTSAPLAQLKDEFGPEVIRLDRGNGKSSRKASGMLCRESYPVVTSRSSEVFVWGGGRHVPQQVEVLTKATAAVQVAAGIRHFAALTVEKEVFTWAVSSGGGKMLGQLGHGDLALYRKPRRIDSLCGQAIVQVACGDEFTVCLTDEGRVLAFGSNYWGCLGNGEDVETDEIEPKPTAVPFFTADSDATRVRRIAAGATFVFAATASGDVYSWGNGDMGQLGLKSEECHSTPQKVKLPPGGSIRRIVCGIDNAFIVMKSGRLLACGSNENNKSCLDQSIGPRRASINSGEPAITTVHMQLGFQPVKALRRFRIVNVAAGSNHSAAVDAFGHVFTFGDNAYGQLGSGNFRSQKGAKRVGGSLLGKEIIHVACGDAFTMVASSDQHVYSWGRGDHGQLCSNAAASSSSPATNQRTGNALPRPVFSALHTVSGLSCKDWHGIMIAEKVLSTRTINSVNSPVKESVDGLSAATTADGRSFPELGLAGNDTDEIPSWVAEALDQSVIPMPSKHAVSLPHRTSSPAALHAIRVGEAPATSGSLDEMSPPSSGQRRGSKSLVPGASVRKHSPLRSSISTPVSTSQRAGSPGRKAVLSVAPPPIVSTVTTGSSHVQHQHQHRRSSSSSASSPCSPAAAGVGGGGGATSSRRKTSVPLVHQLHSPLSRSHSAGKSLAIDEDAGEQMTEVERLRQQVADLQHERDAWRKQAEVLQGDRRQLLREIDVAANKTSDLTRMNQRLCSAHKEIEQLFHAWVYEINAAIPGAIDTGFQRSLSSSSVTSKTSVMESRSMGAPAFRGLPKSPKASKRDRVKPSGSPEATGARQEVRPIERTRPSTTTATRQSSSSSVRGPPTAKKPVPASPWHKTSDDADQRKLESGRPRSGSLPKSAKQNVYTPPPTSSKQ